MTRWLFLQSKMRDFSSEPAFFDNFTQTIERIKLANSIQPDGLIGPKETT